MLFHTHTHTLRLLLTKALSSDEHHVVGATLYGLEAPLALLSGLTHLCHLLLQGSLGIILLLFLHIFIAATLLPVNKLQTNG